MKTWILAGTIGIVGLGGAGNALAAPATITVKVNSNFSGASVEVSPKSASCTRWFGEPLVLPFEFTPNGTTEVYLNEILNDGVECGESRSKKKEKANVKIELPPKLNFPFTVTPSEYQWSNTASRWIDDVLNIRGLPNSCEAAEDGKTPGEDGTRCKPIRNGNGLAFELTTPFEKGEIVAKYEKSEIRIPVAPCEFDVRGPLPGIVAGASEQILYLTPSDKTPNCRLQNKTATLNDSNGSKLALAQVEDFGLQGQGIRLMDIPSDVAEGGHNFKINIAGGLAAVVRAQVIPAVTMTQLVVKYNVPAKQDTYGHFAAASGEAVKDKDGNRFAVVSKLKFQGKDAVVNTSSLSWPSALVSSNTGTTDRGKHAAAVVELVKRRKTIDDKEKELEAARKDLREKIYVPSQGTPKTPEAGVAAVESSPEFKKQRKILDEINELEKRQRDEARTELSDFVWRATTANTSIHLLSVEDSTTKEYTGDLHQIAFVVDDAIPSAPTAILELEQTLKPEFQEVSATRRVLKLNVPLAAKARVESLPLPARDLLEVVCNDEKVTFWNSEVHSIRETAIPEGECRVQLKHGELQSTSKDSANWAKLQEKWTELQTLLPLYGPQTFSVIVRRGGLESKQLWQFSPTEPDEPVADTSNKRNKAEPVKRPFWAQSVTLEEPRSAEKTDAYYTVEVRPIANQNIAVEYRNSSLLKIDQETLKAAGELTFETRLRSRGSFAIPPWGEGRFEGEYKKPTAYRTYFSASVIASALRFPSAESERRSSTSSAQIQYVTPVVGALWSLERWDYDRGHNPWALNPVLQAGGHFYKRSNGDTSFNPLVGVAMTLPIIQEETPVGSQLGSKATLGAFLEWDFRDNTPHGLIAISVNVGSLLSGK